MAVYEVVYEHYGHCDRRNGDSAAMLEERKTRYSRCLVHTERCGACGRLFCLYCYDIHISEE